MGKLQYVHKNKKKRQKRATNILNSEKGFDVVVAVVVVVVQTRVKI
jgi:hypothetical protein